MQIKDRFGRIKKAFFTGLVEMRCFDMHSYSILMVVCLIRFVTEMTVIDFSKLIGDSWFEYLFQAEKFMNIFIELQPNIYEFCGIVFIILTCVVFFYCIFTIQIVQKSYRVKTIYMKVFSLIVYTFRVFLVKALSQIIGITFPNGQIEWVIIAALAIASLIIVMLIIEEFYVSISLQSVARSLLMKSPHPLNMISEGILLTIVILSQLLPKQNIIVTTGLCILFILCYTLKLLSSTLRKKYPDPMMESIQKVHCMSGIIFYLLVIPGYYIELLKQNLLVSDIVVIIFCVASYSNYLNSLRIHGINFLESSVKSKEELQSRKGKFYSFQAHYLIHYINHLMTEYKGQKQQILLSGIFSQHVRSCKSHQCYCSRVSQSNSVQKLMMEKQFRGKFLLSFVENIFNEFNHQFDIFALYLMFKLQVIGIFPEIEHAIIKYETKNYSHLKIGQQYILFQIKRTLRKTIDEKNRYVSDIKLETVIQQEQKCKYLINLMKSIVELTVKKYRLLGEAIINLKSVQQTVDKTSSLIKQIQLNYLESISKNSYNLYTQSLFYQYFTAISETNSQASTILNNIVLKSNTLKSIKGITTVNMEKYLYEDNCCVLQTCLQPDKMGNITNLNENSLHVFGFKKQQLIHQNIKKIIPKHFNQEHQKSMKTWLSTASYQNINQLKNIYLTNQKSTAFKSIVYHQVTTSMDRVKIYVMVLKISGDNFLMIDQEMKIQGFGQKIKDNILTLKTLKQPIKNYCLNTRVLPEDINNLQPDKEYKIDLLLCQQKGSFGQIKTYDPTANLAQQIQQFALKVLQSNRQLRVLKCKISMYLMTFGNVKYLIMKLIDVIQHTMLQSDIQQIEDSSFYQMSGMQQKGTSKNLGRQKVLLGQNSFTYRNLQQCPQNDIGQEIVEDDEESATQINSEDDQLMKNYQLQEMQNQSTSSTSRQSVGYSFKKLIKLIKEKFLFQKNVTYRQLNNITFILAIFIIMLFVALIVQYVFYKSRLQSFQKIMDANQQVSDTLQYVELMFSQSILIYQNCILLSNGPQCDKAIKSISFSYNNLFDQVSTQTQNFMTSKATDDFPFYQYLNQVVNVTLSKIQSSMTIQSFLSVFYHTVKKIALHFQNEKTMNTEMEDSFTILKDNWDLVVQINHQVLNIYQQKGLNQMDIISTILFCITGGVIFLNLLLVVLINYFIGKSIDKRQKLIRNYQYIPISYVEQMKRYFQNLLESLINTKKTKQQLKKQDFPSIQDSPYYRPKNQFFYSRTFAKRLLLLIYFFICLTGSNLFSLFEMRRVLQPFQTIFVEESKMINSQKNVIESYYQLKRNYLLETNQTVRNQRLALLETKFQKKEVQFNDRAIKLLQIFNDTSSDYYHDFKHLLKDDICEISKPIISEWQYDSCKNSHLDYPQYGIFSSMILIQRASMMAMQVLKTVPPQVAPMVLNDAVYQDIDMYIIFAVKVFYLMETRINHEMQAFLQNAYFACFLMILLQFLFLLIGILTWVWFYHKKKKQFTKLYGHVIIFPNQVIIKNKLVMKFIEQTLLIKDY